MAHQANGKPPVNAQAWRYVFAAGLIAGALDITYACAFWGWKAGVAPTRIFQSVAAGLLGQESFAGGLPTAALGLGLHFAIAIAMALAYYLAARRFSPLHKRVWLCGLLYGLLLYGVMNFVVVPLSSAGPGSIDPLWLTLSVAVHMLFVGLPCALFAKQAIQSATTSDQRA